MTGNERCRVFVGSSTEGQDLARALQSELLNDCEITLWSQDGFRPGEFTLDSLIRQAHEVDFAVFVATPDDTRESRGLTHSIPRDNVILEYGLFVGVLGRERAFLLTPGGTTLPSDSLGITRLSYSVQQNQRAAVSSAAQQMRDSFKRLGRVRRTTATHSSSSDGSALESEIQLLTRSAEAQGWTVKDSQTALRLTSPRGRSYALSKSTPGQTRAKLRPFAAQLRSQGLRVSLALRRAVADSPLVQ